ncbi:MAG: cytochrome ubiquinol oxidase subunit I, partial [Gammaproteobacteria bacterium]|nr:cytochrome ubiquinol oxidase subunit I [Gammaproteobacteria bacterium]
YLFAIPNQKTETNSYEVKIPYALSLIATHSLTGTVEGVDPIVQTYVKKVTDGIKAYTALNKIWAKTATKADMETYQKHVGNLGFAYLLLPYTDNVEHATSAQILQAAKSGIPNVSTAFWSFRLMIGLWFVMFILIICGMISSWRNTLVKNRFLLRCCLWAIPLPYIAAEAGWMLAEVGRQPWAIHDILPVFMGTSSLNEASLISSLVLFVIFYSALLSVELFLMFKFARLGPSSLGTGKYHFEKK